MAQCVWLLTFEHPSDLPPYICGSVQAAEGMRETQWVLAAFKPSCGKDLIRVQLIRDDPTSSF